MLTGQVTEEAGFSLKGTVGIGRSGGYEEYSGSYEVQSRKEDYLLETKGLLMSEDVKVKGISYAEEENAGGGLTVRIGV